MSRAGDPRLKTPGWKRIRAYWLKVREPQCQAAKCLMPGVPINYTRTGTPASLDVGHRELRDHDPRKAWTIADTRPEHARCNRSHGATYRHTKRAPTSYSNPAF